MASRPALLRLVADACDQIVHDTLASQGFQLAPPLAGRTIRRYLTQRQFRDVDIEVFLDSQWAGEGIVVRIQTRALVHPVQQALEKAPQSLLAPRAGTPLSVFELGPHADDLPGSWRVQGPGDVTGFAAGLLVYLRDVAMPWLRNTESLDAVLAHLAEMKQVETRDRLVSALKAEGHLA